MMMENFLSTIYDQMAKRKTHLDNKPIPEEDFYSINNNLVASIKKELPEKGFKFIAENIDLNNIENILFATENKAYIENLDFDNLKFIISTKKLNIIKNINSHLSSVNKLLPDAGIYVGISETNGIRKRKIYKKYGSFLGQLIWLSDFILNRVIPKTKPFKKIYQYITNGKFHCLSLAETLGRLVYNGFEIIDFEPIGGVTYYICIKTNAPSTYKNPSYHPLIKLMRIGKNNKFVGIYKLRTMHPYSEYLQDYIVDLHGYNKKGKPANDFRITRWGKVFRKLWLDEIPQLFNLIKGEISIVGVRPISKARFKALPKTIQNERGRYKPGLIPPYVSLNMPDDKGNIVAEEIYLKEKKEHPIRTDIKYFLLAVYNILTGKILSA